MSHSICIFEDNKYSQLYPLSLTRPVFDLHCGILSLKKKIIQHFPSMPINLYCRDYLKDVVQQQNPHLKINKIDSESCLFINGRILIDSNLVKVFNFDREEIYFSGDQIIGAFLKKDNIKNFVNVLKSDAHLKEFNRIPTKKIQDIHLINYPWDLIQSNPLEIKKDFEIYNKGGMIKGEVSQYAALVNKNNIYIGKDAVIKPGAVLDANEGPIYIDEGALVMSNSVIQGPCYIGRKSKIKMLAKIYEGTSIGEVCKVGGEVEQSIIHSYSNKQHDGFLGHAYLGQWVNIGADTNNSDLKNNYSTVKVYMNGKMIDSGLLLMGLLMGDHSKTGINTMFNTGTVVGTMCNVFGSGFPAKYIPSFSWGGVEETLEHKFDKALETARLVMKRRDVEMTNEYQEMFKYIFELTRSNRKS